MEGDKCSLVSVANKITLMDFHFLNPVINAECSNLLLSEAFCVVPVSSITIYTSYPITTPLFTVIPATSVVPSIPATTSEPGYIYTPTYLPIAPDTLADCESYRNYSDTSTFANSCIYIAFTYHVTTGQLMEWNPSLSTNVSTCALQPGYSYCVVQSDDSSKP